MDIYKLELTPEERKDLSKEIREALHENYILKAEGETDEDCMVHDILVAFTWQLRRTLSKFIPLPDAKREAELRTILIKTFAQTVEYGAMCSECCSSQGDGAKVLCEMSDKPLKPDDHCPQQIACIESVLPEILNRFGERKEHSENL